MKQCMYLHIYIHVHGRVHAALGGLEYSQEMCYLAFQHTKLQIDNLQVIVIERLWKSDTALQNERVQITILDNTWLKRMN